MRIFKSHPLLKLVNSYLIDSPQPSNISYWWNFGSLLGLCLIIQIITGVTLAMHYNPSVLEAFNSVEHMIQHLSPIPIRPATQGQRGGASVSKEKGGGWCAL